MATRQADILFQAINAQQSVEMDKLQLQAMELMEDEDKTFVQENDK